MSKNWIRIYCLVQLFDLECSRSASIPRQITAVKWCKPIRKNSTATKSRQKHENCFCLPCAFPDTERNIKILQRYQTFVRICRMRSSFLNDDGEIRFWNLHPCDFHWPSGVVWSDHRLYIDWCQILPSHSRTSLSWVAFEAQSVPRTTSDALVKTRRFRIERLAIWSFALPTPRPGQ